MLHKTITVSQQKGGAGKTTIAAHLSIALAQQGYHIAILDTDPQGSLDAWFCARQNTDNFRDLTPLTFSRMTDKWRIRREIERLEESHDFLIIDCPPHAQEESRIAVQKADLVIIPMQPSPMDLWATSRIVELTNIEEASTRILLNRVNRNSRLGRRFIEELPRCRFDNYLGNRVSFPSAMADGLSVTETSPYSVAAQEIWMITEEVEQFFGAIADTNNRSSELA